MTLFARDFRKEPLPLSHGAVPQKSCLKKYIVRSCSCNNKNTKEQQRDDSCGDDNDSIATEGTEPSTTSSSFFLTATTRGDESKRKNNKNKIVSFGRIEVREFPIILGDNPSPIDGGIPITIDWKPQRRGFFETVDIYEQRRYYDDGPFKKQNRRRHGKELHLDANTRAKLALCGGATFLQLGQTALTITKIQKQRAQSSQKGSLELLREGLFGDRTSPLVLLHSNRKSVLVHQQQQQQQQSSSISTSSCSKAGATFTRVPNEAPRILSAWKANGDQMATMMYSTSTIAVASSS